MDDTGCKFCNSCFKFKKTWNICEKCEDNICDKCILNKKCFSCTFKNCEECNELFASEHMIHIHNNRILDYEEHYFCKSCFIKNRTKYEKKYIDFNI